MQYKKIEIYGKNLEDFELKRNLIGSGIYLLDAKESAAIKHFLQLHIERGMYSWILDFNESVNLLNKINNQINYEEIR